MGCLNDFLSFKEIVFLRVEWGPHVWKILVFNTYLLIKMVLQLLQPKIGLL